MLGAGSRAETLGRYDRFGFLATNWGEVAANNSQAFPHH
jgi:hypothetical protein